MLERRDQRRLVNQVVSLHKTLEIATAETARVEAVLSQTDTQAQELRELEEALALIEAAVNHEADDSSPLRLNDIELLEVVDLLALPELSVAATPAVCRSPGPPYHDPYEALDNLVSDGMSTQLQRESFSAKLRWDSFDFVAVGVAGLLASITDFFLVGLPSGRAAGPITMWLKGYDTTSRAGRDDALAVVARHLEEVCKVPFDSLRGEQAIGGMSGRTHRFQTLGHDPVLGFVFGVLDILRGTITGFSYDKLGRFHECVHMKSPSGKVATNLIEAVFLQLGHLLSDVATPSGLPAPFLTILQAFNTGRFGSESMSLAEVSRRMYTQGYDLRHFVSSGLSQGVAQTVLFGLLSLRAVCQEELPPRNLQDSLKTRRMLFAAHSLAALGNAGKVTLHQGNPLAINQAQWMALFKALLPSIRDIILQDELELGHVEGLIEDDWAELFKIASSSARPWRA